MWLIRKKELACLHTRRETLRPLWLEESVCKYECKTEVKILGVLMPRDAAKLRTVQVGFIVFVFYCSLWKMILLVFFKVLILAGARPGSMLEVVKCWLLFKRVFCVYFQCKGWDFLWSVPVLVDVKIDGIKLKTDANDLLQITDSDLELSFVLQRREKWFFLVSLPFLLTKVTFVLTSVEIPKH